MLFPSNCEAFLSHRRRLTSRLSEKTIAEDAALIAPIFFVCVFVLFTGPIFCQTDLADVFSQLQVSACQWTPEKMEKYFSPLGLSHIAESACKSMLMQEAALCDFTGVGDNKPSRLFILFFFYPFWISRNQASVLHVNLSIFIGCLKHTAKYSNMYCWIFEYLMLLILSLGQKTQIYNNGCVRTFFQQGSATNAHPIQGTYSIQWTEANHSLASNYNREIKQ